MVYENTQGWQNLVKEKFITMVHEYQGKEEILSRKQQATKRWTDLFIYCNYRHFLTSSQYTLYTGFCCVASTTFKWRTSPYNLSYKEVWSKKCRSWNPPILNLHIYHQTHKHPKALFSHKCWYSYMPIDFIFLVVTVLHFIVQLYTASCSESTAMKHHRNQVNKSKLLWSVVFWHWEVPQL